MADFQYQNYHDHQRLRRIGIISGKGGTGKTTVTINLATSILAFKRDVLAVDGDIKMSGLGLNLGIYKPKITLNSVVNGDFNLLEALHIHSTGIRVIPASLKPQNLDLSNLGEILEKNLPANFVVLLDSPPGLEENFVQTLKSCTESIIVTTPDIQSITNALKVSQKSMEIGVRPIGVILNRYTRDKKKFIGVIESILGVPLLGVIPENNLIQKSSLIGRPYVTIKPHSRTSIQFRKIAAKILGIEYKPTILEILSGIL